MPSLVSRIQDLKKDVRGSNAVEFALVSPIMILLLFVIVFGGIFFGVAHSAQQLAADGVRYSLAGIDRAERLTLAERYVSESASRYFLLSGRDVRVAVEETDDIVEVRILIDMADLPIWFALTDVLAPSRRIVRTATTVVGRSS